MVVKKCSKNQCLHNIYKYMIDINKLQKSIENDKILYAGSNQGKKIYDQIKQKQMH